VVRNLSESGAALLDAMADVAVDSPVVLTIDGLSSSLRGVVVRNDPNGMLLKLGLMEDVRKLVAALIAGRRVAA
jgi:hypothetical protein